MISFGAFFFVALGAWLCACLWFVPLLLGGWRQSRSCAILGDRSRSAAAASCLMPIICISLFAMVLTFITWAWTYPWLDPLPLIWAAWMIGRRIRGHRLDARGALANSGP